MKHRWNSALAAALALFLGLYPALPVFAVEGESIEPVGDVAAPVSGPSQEQAAVPADAASAAGGLPEEDFTWKNEAAPSQDNFPAELPASYGGIPALPDSPIASYSAEDAPEDNSQPSSARPDRQNPYSGAGEFSKLEESLRPKNGKNLSASELGRVFDGTDASAPFGPQGLKSISIIAVRSKADIATLDWSYYRDERAMKRAFGKYLYALGSFDLYAYKDQNNKTFYGVDISKDPGMVDRLPLYDHEKALIKKIQLYNSDMRVLICETGKTPDIVVGGEMVELKSALNGGLTGRALRKVLRRGVKSADRQLQSHGAEHSLRGLAAIAVDLSRFESVNFNDVAHYLSKLNNENPRLRKIYVFTRKNVMSFAKQQDGSFKIDQSRPFVEATAQWSGDSSASLSKLRVKMSRRRKALDRPRRRPRKAWPSMAALNVNRSSNQKSRDNRPPR
jgi:hypothetical protein